MQENIVSKPHQKSLAFCSALRACATAAIW